MREIMPKKPTINLNDLVAINSPADFYGWKKHIIEALRTEGNFTMADRLERETSLLAFFQSKDSILAELGLSEKPPEQTNGGDTYGN